jgi:ribonucleoside-diphosphate reductase alpha chain
MLYKDAANHKSTKKNLGTIRSSICVPRLWSLLQRRNCSVCNLASLSLPMFVENGHSITICFIPCKRVTRNLNKVIDRNYYPVKKENSNKRRQLV